MGLRPPSLRAQIGDALRVLVAGALLVSWIVLVFWLDAGGSDLAWVVWVLGLLVFACFAPDEPDPEL